MSPTTWVGCGHGSDSRAKRFVPSLGVRPFTTFRSPVANTASADFCRVNRSVAARGRRTDAGSRSRHPDRPPRIRTTTFPLRPPHLRDSPLGDDADFAVSCQLIRDAPPHMRFVFLGAGFCLRLPSHDTSRCRSCLQLGLGITSSTRGLPPPSGCPCRAYKERPPGNPRGLTQRSGPVSRILSRRLAATRVAIHLRRTLPLDCSDLPGGYRAGHSPPAWSCSGRGLPSRTGHPARW